MLSPLSLGAVPRVFEGSVVSEIKVPYTAPSPDGAEFCSVWGAAVGMCQISAGSGVNTGFWQCVLRPDWKKPLVNVITVFHFLIMPGFSSGHSCFLRMEQEKPDLQTLCVTAWGHCAGAGCRNNPHLSLLAGQCVCLWISVCTLWCCGAALCHCGVSSHTVPASLPAQCGSQQSLGFL